MRAPRFTVRTLIAFVALAALALFGVTMWRRSVALAAIAKKHHRQMVADRLSIMIGGSSGSRDFRILPLDATPEELEEAHREALSKLTPEENARRRFFLHRAAIEKRQYEMFHRASLYPWLPAPEETKPLLRREPGDAR